MTLFPDPFNTLLGLQEALEAFRTSGWLQPGPSGGGSYPPLPQRRRPRADRRGAWHQQV